MGGAWDISSFCNLDAHFPTSEPSHCGADEVYRTSASVASTARLSSMAPVTWLSVTIGSTAEFPALGIHLDPKISEVKICQNHHSEMA